jgi:hypothetical protein
MRFIVIMKNALMKVGRIKVKLGSSGAQPVWSQSLEDQIVSILKNFQRSSYQSSASKKSIYHSFQTFNPQTKG